MRFQKPAIIAAVVFGVTCASLGAAAPALAATQATPTKSTITVKVDKADQDATVTTKKGTFTVRWEAINKGKMDLVTVRNSNHKLVAARDVSAKKVDRVLANVAKHPGAIRHLWVKAHHAKKATTAKTTTK